MSFELCIPVILGSEGGYINDPRDPGGPTNRGITIDTLTGFLGRRATVDDVERLTEASAEAIYRTNYYNPAHGPDLLAGVDLMVFDMAVNSGVGKAILLLQRAVGVTADGHFGPQTLAVIKAADRAGTIDRIHDTHERFYRALPTFGAFGRGWLSRNDRTRALALQMQ